MGKIHGVREVFSLKKFMEARELTKKVVNKVAQAAFEGMTEEDGLQLIDKYLNEMGADKKWHPNKFRIGKNTNKSFSDPSVEGVSLSKNDIFFLDIGPVWDGHEGDYGETFIFGENSDLAKLANDAKNIFAKVTEAWKVSNLTGKELYEFAKEQASTFGYNLNDKMKGHRVGDFPHHLFYRGGMSEIDEIPCENLWVLEIHLITKDGKFGSFYEDILK